MEREKVCSEELAKFKKSSGEYIKDKKELFNLYSQSDVQLLFSKKSRINKWEELFGMVIIEAIYCGVVTIATKHVGSKSINKFLENPDLFNYLSDFDNNQHIFYPFPPSFHE